MLFQVVRKIVLCAIAALVALCCIVPGALAYAMDTNSLTAKPNAETGSAVLGGKETRITWEVEAQAAEHIATLALTLPEGCECALQIDGANSATYRLTVLTGENFMTRNQPEADVVALDNVVTIAFVQPVTESSAYRIRLELYGVVFSAAGGEMQLAGTYTLEDGTSASIDTMPIITVEGTPLLRQITDWLEQQEWVQAWNSVTFLRLFLNPVLIVSSFPVVLRGFAMALAVVAVAFPLAIPIGLLLALMRMSKVRILRGLGSLYVNVVRGTPMFLQLYIAFLGLPLAGINIPDYILAFLVLALNSAAYMCEIFRAGIQSIPKGQFEASRSLGMTGAQTMLFVIIPQTVRRVLPTMTNEFILLYKDTSLLAGVGFMEIVMYARSIVASTGSITPYIVAALFYLVITIPLANVVGRLEARLAGNDGGAASAKTKKKAAQNTAADAQNAAAGAKQNATANAKLKEAPEAQQTASSTPEDAAHNL